jgi:hypothetical protein
MSILTSFEKNKSALRREFCIFLTLKYEIHNIQRLKLKEKCILYFGLRIQLPIQKCMKKFDFDDKVKITAP